ncbi:MAG: tRNA threonylcarbamoyladenosine biosynthesis protein TsaE [Verrucomicrobiales bacterium]|jgi:tRNA threonylcarbamoyladenosine biosynthesis protein TsaE
MLDPQRRTLGTPKETHRVGADLAVELKAGDVIGLTGTLGAGKTHLSQGIVEGLGSQAAVTSPTFGLVHEYTDGRLSVYHFDFYRIEVAEELLELGWDDYLDRDGVVIVEWADRFPDLMPEQTQWWRLQHDEETGGRLLERLP